MIRHKRVHSRKISKKQNQHHLQNALRNVIEALEGRVLLAYSVDPSFSGDGLVEGFGGSVFAVQADNKIVAVADDNRTIIRFNVDGSTDSSFGGTGHITSPFPAQDILLSGSRIIVAGANAQTNQFKIASYNLNGTPDLTFGGGDGVAEAPVGVSAAVGDLEIAPDGKFIVGGYSWGDPFPDNGQADQISMMNVARFTANGTLDTSFAGDGTFEDLMYDYNGTGAGVLQGVGVQSDGKIVLSGNTTHTSSGRNQYWVFRLNANGTYDATFTSQHLDQFDGMTSNAFTDLEITGGDRILISDYNRILQLNADGTFDTTFNQMGVGAQASIVGGIQPLADGRILATGYVGGGASSQPFATRLLANGDPDPSFNGLKLVRNQGAWTLGDDVLPDNQNRIIVGFSTYVNGEPPAHRWLARLADFPQAPFKGTPFNPGDTIQAEDFDNGGEGVAYHDTDATNNGGAYRNEAVDIEVTSDTGGGLDVGWTNPGEWMEYTFNVLTAGTYTIDTRLASPKTGGSFHYEVDGINASGVISIPNTGSFQSFRTITSNLGQLSAGTHVLRLAIDSGPNAGGQANFNWMKISQPSGGGGGGTGLGLTGEYFNNMDFTAPVLTRNDSNINFNWGTGSPDPRIDPDTFSVIWSGAIQAPTTGRYTFYTTTDDGVRLTIAGQNIIDHLQPQAATEWSGSIDLVAGQKYDLHMAYFERAGGAQARLSWSGPGIAKQIVPPSAFSNGSGDTQPPGPIDSAAVTDVSDHSATLRWSGASDNVAVTGFDVWLNNDAPITVGGDVRAYFFDNLKPGTNYTAHVRGVDAAGNRGPTYSVGFTTDASTSGNGLNGTYFNNMDFTAPVFTRRDPNINFNWGTGSPDPRMDADTFSVRWTGQILAPTTGRYTFYTTSDDGARLTINGQRIIDKLVPQASTEWSGSIDLVAGQKYSFTMEYFDRYGGALAKLQWAGPGISKQVVPQSAFSPT
jgi:uncharacterized delta-60 repeat protein